MIQITLPLHFIRIPLHGQKLQITDQRSKGGPKVVRHGCHQFHIRLFSLVLHKLLVQYAIFQALDPLRQPGDLVIAPNGHGIFQISASENLQFLIQPVDVADFPVN